MKSELYQCLNVYKKDYERLLARKQKRVGMTLAGLFHEALERSEGTPRNKNGKFAKKEDDDA